MAKATKFTSSYRRAASTLSHLCNNRPVLITTSSSRLAFDCVFSFLYFSSQQQGFHLTSSQLREQGRVVPVPGCRFLRADAHVLSAPCDDRFILELASRSAAVVVSNDSFNDLVPGKPEWQVVAENRLIRCDFFIQFFSSCSREQRLFQFYFRWRRVRPC